MTTFSDLLNITAQPEVVEEGVLRDLLTLLRTGKDQPSYYEEQYFAELNAEETAYFKDKYRQEFGTPIEGKVFAHAYRALDGNTKLYLPWVKKLNLRVSMPDGSTTAINCGVQTVEFEGRLSNVITNTALATPLGKFGESIKASGLGTYLQGMDIFPNYRRTEDYRQHAVTILPSSYSMLVFRDDFSAGKVKNTESKFFTHTFPDLHANAKATKTLLTVDGVPSAAAVYQAGLYSHNYIVVPIAFHRLFDGCKTKAQHLDRFRVILHKLGNAIDVAFNSPEARRKKMEDSVGTALTFYYKQGVHTKRQQVLEAQSERDRLREHYARQYRQSILLELELEGLKNNQNKVDTLKGTIKEQLGELEKVGKIKSIRFEGTCLVFDTNFLRFFNPDTKVLHQLGEMTVYVDLNNFSFTFQNKSMKFQDGFDHPHILAGRPCLGNFGLGLPELLMEGQVYTFCDLIIAFLETCNSKDEWGKNAIYWPIVDESLAVPEWPTIKAGRIKDYIMKPVKEPEVVVPDDKLLDQVVQDGIETQIVQQVEEVPYFVPPRPRGGRTLRGTAAVLAQDITAVYDPEQIPLGTVGATVANQEAEHFDFTAALEGNDDVEA